MRSVPTSTNLTLDALMPSIDTFLCEKVNFDFVAVLDPSKYMLTFAVLSHADIVTELILHSFAALIVISPPNFLPDAGL